MCGQTSLSPDERLAQELQDRRDYVDGVAYKLDRRLTQCWWLTLGCAGVASALGFIAEIPSLREKIDPWMVSAFSLIAGSVAIVRQKSSWRIKSNLFYRHRDDIDDLLSKLRYELPKPISSDSIAQIAREYRQKKLEWGEKMRTLNEMIDDHTDAPHQPPKGEAR